MTDLSNLEAELSARVAAAADVAALEAVRVEALGKSGSISELLKTLGRMTPDERREQGPKINGLRDAVATVPRIEGYGVVRVDEHTIEVEVSNGQGLNEVFARLGAAGHEIVSMRNKVNRLEEIFMRVVDGRAAGAQAAAAPAHGARRAHGGHP